MRNYNNQDIEKVEKAAEKALKQIKKKLPSTPKILKPKYLLSTLAFMGLSYIGYRIYEHKAYVNSHYVDLFDWKVCVSNSVQKKDMFQKLKDFSLTQNTNYAVEEYERKLRQQFEVFIEKIKQKRVLNLAYNLDENLSDERLEQKQKSLHKDERVDNRMQIILTKNTKSWLNLGYFKLHTKQYVNTISNKRDYAKKTYISPIILFETSFFGGKKQQVKRMGKKDRYSKVIKNKSHFDLHSQCQKINYWNLLINHDRPYQVKTEINEIDMGGSKMKMEESQNGTVKQKLDGKNKKQYGNFKTELLFQCRKKIRKVEEDFKKQLIEAVDQYWQNKPKEYGSY